MLGRREFSTGLAASILSGPAFARTPHAQVVSALRGGGHVILFRHAAAGPQRNDWHTMPREEQRNLSDIGIAQAERIGRRFRALGISVGDVRSSPFFRCTDTADLAFGRHVVDMGLLSILSSGGPRGRVRYLRELLASDPGRDNLVLVSHTQNIAAVSGITVEEGEALVFHATPGKQGFALLTRMRAGLW